MTTSWVAPLARLVMEREKAKTKPRLRWRHRGDVRGVVLDDWLVQEAGDISKAPLIAVHANGYRLCETEILEYLAQ